MMQYTLMNKNTEVFGFSTFENSLDIEYVDTALHPEYAPLGIEIDDGTVNRNDFSNWLRLRGMPASRKNLRQGLELLSDALGQNINVEALHRHNLCLSLSDQYWIKPQGSNIKWENINFFTNDFSKDMGRIFFNNERITSPDLMSPDASCGGWLHKKWIINDGKRTLVKGSTNPYQQEAFNEAIASAICGRLGIKHISYTATHTSKDGSVSACDCFIDENTELITAEEIRKKFNATASKASFEQCCKMLHITDYEKSINDMLLLDYIIDNKDRHFANFGAIRDVSTLKFIGMAPIFDSGTSLQYDKDTNHIDISSDIEAKPFADSHIKQLKLISSSDGYDFTKLNGLRKEIFQMFNDGHYPYVERVNVIADLVQARVESAEKELCNGLTSGITIQKNTSH